MKELKRFGVSIESDLLSRFDRFIRKQGYTNRSEAIRDLIRELLLKREDVPKKTVVGILSVVYDHHVPNLINQLIELQHAFLGEITSTLHIHLDRHHCLEVLVVRDQAGRIQKLHDAVKSLKKVEHVSLSFTTEGF